MGIPRAGREVRLRDLIVFSAYFVSHKEQLKTTIEEKAALVGWYTVNTIRNTRLLIISLCLYEYTCHGLVVSN